MSPFFLTYKTKPPAELVERVWTYSFRAAYWSLRHDVDGLALLDKLRTVGTQNQPAQEVNRFVSPLLDREIIDRGAVVMSVAAQALRPGLDALAAEYGVAIDEAPPPEALIDQSVGALGELEGSLRTLAEGVPAGLQAAAVAPGRPLPYPRIITVAHLDDWPLTSLLEELIEVDPETRNMVTWIYDGYLQAEPAIFEAIPEPELDVDYHGILACLGYLSRFQGAAPFKWMSRTDKHKGAQGCHPSASREAIEDFCANEGFAVLSAEDVLRTARAWRAYNQRRLESVPRGSDDPWSTYWFVRRSPLDGAGEIIRSHQGDDISEAQLIAQLATRRRHRTEGNWLLHLAVTVGNSADVRDALREEGFTRGDLARCNAMLDAEFAIIRGVSPQLDDLPCAPWPVCGPEADPRRAALEEVLFEDFPVEIGSFLLDIELVRWPQCTAIVCIRRRTNSRVHLYDQGEYRLLTSAEVDGSDIRATLRARFARLRETPEDDLARLFEHHHGTLLDRPQPISESLAAVVENYTSPPDEGAYFRISKPMVDAEGKLRAQLDYIFRPAAGEAQVRYEGSVVLLDRISNASAELLTLKLKDPDFRRGLTEHLDGTVLQLPESRPNNRPPRRNSAREVPGSNFERFNATWASLANQSPVPKETREKYVGVLPQGIFDFWDAYGLCSIADGLLWAVDPMTYDDVVRRWVPADEYAPVAAFRTSFGSLIFWNAKLGGFEFLNVPRGEVRALVSRVDLLVNRYFTDPTILERDYLQRMHQQALERLGPIGRDECYAFEPALALGGDMSADNLTIAKVLPHLDLLAQVTDVLDLD